MNRVLARALHDARHQLEGLADRAAWCYSLAYEPSQRGWRVGLMAHDDDRLPVRLTLDRFDEDGNLVKEGGALAPHAAAACPQWAENYHQAAREVALADRNVAKALAHLGVTRPPLQTWHIMHGVTPQPWFLTRLCRYVAEGIDLIGADDAAKNSKALKLLYDGKGNATLRIDRAHRLLPDTRVHRPEKCRNPRGREGCDYFPVTNAKRGLCRPCNQHEKDRARGKAGTRQG